ncbi:MAG TPA: hypothetical protein VGJ25_01235, partial [Gaiellaceae bacterium]
QALTSWTRRMREPHHVPGPTAGLRSPPWAITCEPSVLLRSYRKAGIRYKPGKQPLVIDVLRASSDRLLSEEVEGFVELLEDLGDSADARKVLAHLRDCEAIVTVQLLSDINDDGYKAVDVFLRFFVDHCGAMIQADGEGFYERDRLLVELP